jgi:hypothetical protein
LKTISFRQAAPGQEPAAITDLPSLLDAHWSLAPDVRERALGLLPLIMADCLQPSESWPPYMPNLSEGVTAFPDYPWKRSAAGAFAFEAITVAVAIAEGRRECPPELSALPAA